MEVLSLTCSNCGAPLEVPAKTRFVTCQYCDSRLEIHHSGNAVYTEVLDELSERTDQIAEDVEIIKLQNQLEQLDREWELERERFMVSGRNGQRYIPNANTSVIGGVVALVFGLFWTAMAASIGGPSFFPLFGILFIGFGLYTSINGYYKANQYQQALGDYEGRRAQLMREIQGRG